MMRRNFPLITKSVQDRFSRFWPWVLGLTIGTLYLYNPDPFDDLAANAVTKIRRPLLAATQLMDIHDIDTEAAVLELPPTQLFGPLPLKVQFKFLLESLKADNELADDYLARLLIDHMDLSIDMPGRSTEAPSVAEGADDSERHQSASEYRRERKRELHKRYGIPTDSIDSPVYDEYEGSTNNYHPVVGMVTENMMLEYGALDLLDFAVNDFLGKRANRRHKFFTPDKFICLINWFSLYPRIAHEFVTKYDGVNLLRTAHNHAKVDYSRIFVMRSLMLCALQQPKDGEVEKRILSTNAFKEVILPCYYDCTGDSTDSRFTTTVVSSIIRHFPGAARLEFLYRPRRNENNQENAGSNAVSTVEGRGGTTQDSPDGGEIMHTGIGDKSLVYCVVNGINTARYKALEQHLRVLKDLRRSALPDEEFFIVNRAFPETRLIRPIPTARVWGAGWARPIEPNMAFKEKEESRSLLMRGLATLADLFVHSPHSESAAENPLPLPPPDVAVHETSLRPGLVTAAELDGARPPGPVFHKDFVDVDRALVEADVVPVLLGIIDVFPEYYEGTRDAMSQLLSIFIRARRMPDIEPLMNNSQEEVIATSSNTVPQHPLLTPLELLEYRIFPIMAKVYSRFALDEEFIADGVLRFSMAKLAEAIFSDEECQRALQPEVMDDEIAVASDLMKKMIEEEQRFRNNEMKRYIKSTDDSGNEEAPFAGNVVATA